LIGRARCLRPAPRQRSRRVVGVFADRARATHLARAHARARAANLRREDEETCHAPVAADLYEIFIEDRGPDLDVSVRQRFLRTPTPNRWCVRQFTLVAEQEPAALSEYQPAQ
jgi:hypothetical protein